MSAHPVGTASAAPRPVTELHYLWSDLRARRPALGLRREELAELLRTDEGRYWSRENGDRNTGPLIVAELIEMERFVAQQAQQLLDDAPPAPTMVVLAAVPDQDQFDRTYPAARTLRHGVHYPVTLQHVAVGRAAATLTRRGYDVEVHRGDRRADLLVRRLACGLLKNETAALLGLSQKKYNAHETGKAAPPAGLIAELQAVDDFITTTASQLTVGDVNGVPVVFTLDDPAEFPNIYPQARTRRDGNAYPVRVHHVAAALRASALTLDGAQPRIAVPAD